jgi:transposase InsO family protein
VNRRHRGRLATAVEIRRLIEGMVESNPLWRAPRLHGELEMLGIEISERTVSRILRKLPRPPSQTWKTFLRNHIGQMVSIDFFTVPTVTMRVLFVFLVLEHRRRQVLHFNVTEHPTADWTSQQIVEAFADRDAPRYLIRDRDSIYGSEVRLRIASLGIEEVLAAPRSPWQNPYLERLIGSIRRDCLNHFVILNAFDHALVHRDRGRARRCFRQSEVAAAVAFFNTDAVLVDARHRNAISSLTRIVHDRVRRDSCRLPLFYTIFIAGAVMCWAPTRRAGPLRAYTLWDQNIFHF